MLTLLRELQRDFGTAIVLITHDLGVVAGLCDQVVVMYGGRVMEQGSAQQLFKTAAHPYTLGLLKAVPRMDRDDESLLAIPGAPPNMAHLPQGCPFSPRCSLADTQCQTQLAPLQPMPDATQHLRACHRDSAIVRRELAHG
jgi:oligopeptide transport system ATP-binding protein